MSGTQMKVVMGELDTRPNVARSDLEGLVQLLDAIYDAFGGVHNEIYVERAVLQVSNSSGYPVGHVSFDAETDLYKFTPHQDEEA